MGDHPGLSGGVGEWGPDVVIRVIIRWRQKGQNQRMRCDDTSRDREI